MKDERDLRRDADAQPDHEQRRQDHARDGVEHAHHRLQQLGNEGNQRGGNAQQDADHDAERQATQRRREGRLEVRPDASVGEQVDERDPDPAWARREQRIEQAGAARRLPQREHQPQRDQPAQPGIARIEHLHAASAR